MYNQLYQYFENIPFPSTCRFRIQHAVLSFSSYREIKEAIDTVNKFRAVLIDLSKGFDCLDHPLLIAKLYCYELSPLFLKLIFSYFSDHTHRTKIKECIKIID